jgi:signal peptidase I
MVDPALNPFIEKPVVPQKKGARFVNMLQAVAILSIVGVVMYLFVLTPNQIDGFSMFPTFNDDQIVFVNRVIQLIGNTSLGKSLKYEYQRGDVIVMKVPSHEKEIIKRIVGIPGDQIHIKDGDVYLNGVALSEKYLDPELKTQGGTFITEGGDPIFVAPGTVLVLGDNRNNSLDSRFVEIGLVKREYIIGKVFLRLLPLDTFTFIGTGETEFKN